MYLHLLRDQVFRCMSRNLDNTEEMAKYCGWDVSDGKLYHCLSLDSMNFLWSPM